MLLINFDFWTTVLFAAYVLGLVLAYRFIWLLARFSEGFIISLAKTGMHGVAKSMLSLMISYDKRTYHKSRYTVWNQVKVRFALLWATVLAIALISYAVKSWAAMSAIFTIVLILVWWSKWITPITQFDSFHDVNERQKEGYQQGQTHVKQTRQWDYLDELFA